jgi:hypothetical protein
MSADFLPEIAASLGAEAALFVGGRETARDRSGAAAGRVRRVFRGG